MARTSTILTSAEIEAVEYLASLTPNTVVITNGSGFVISSSVTPTELGYLSGVTGNIQTQLNSKENTITPGTTAQYWRGDKTWQTLDTSVVPENGNLYYTNARAIASTLTGYTSGAGTITSADTILGAIQKLNGNIGALIQTHNALPDLQGGTTNQYYHLTSAEYTGTGTGNFVRSTSPTLVTPNLGTPSSVTLTNATGLPVSTGISGLGTGIATFLATPSSANLAAALTDETGTGSVVFSASPTFTGVVSMGTLRADGVGGLLLEGSAGQDVALFGAGGTQDAVFYGNVSPATNDGASLGTSSLMWSDLFLASGGVINFNAGNYTITHSAGNLSFSGSVSGITNLTTTGNANIGTNDTNTHIFRGAFSLAYGSGSTTRLSMTNTGLLMLGASTTPVAGIQLESGNTGSGTPGDYVLIKSSGSVANRGGLLISNQASVSGTTNSLKITGTFNSSTSGVASVGWVENNATETWVGGVSSMIFAYNASSPFIRFNQTTQILAGQIIQSSGSTSNYINIDNSGNSIYATRSSARIQIDEDNNTTATAFFQVFADAGTVNLFQIREDGQTQFQYNVATANAVTITGTTLTTGSSLRVYDNGADTGVRRVIFATNDNSLATGCIVAHLQQDSTANALFIDHNDNGISINVDAENTTANALDIQSDVITTGYIGRFYSNSTSTSTRSLLGIINDNTLATGTTCLYIQNDSTGNIASFTGGVTSSNGLFIQTDSLTTGSVAYFYSNSANTSTRSLVRIVNDNAAATGTTVLTIRQDSTGQAVNVTGGISVLAESTTSYASLRLPHGTAPTAPVDGDIWTTTSSVYARVNGSTIDLGSGGGGATTALDNLSSVAINTSLLLGTSDGGALGSTTKMWSDLYLASGGIIDFDNGNTTITHSSSSLAITGASNFSMEITGRATITCGETGNNTLNVQNNTASLASTVFIASSNSTSSITRNIGGFANLNASAVNTYPLALSNSAVVSTNFKRMINFDSGANVLWRSDGTSPNGSLSGTVGDICFNGDGGKVYYCTGTTNWTAM